MAKYLSVPSDIVSLLDPCGLPFKDCLGPRHGFRGVVPHSQVIPHSFGDRCEAKFCDEHARLCSQQLNSGVKLEWIVDVMSRQDFVDQALKRAEQRLPMSGI